VTSAGSNESPEGTGSEENEKDLKIKNEKKSEKSEKNEKNEIEKIESSDKTTKKERKISGTTVISHNYDSDCFSSGTISPIISSPITSPIISPKGKEKRRFEDKGVEGMERVEGGFEGGVEEVSMGSLSPICTAPITASDHDESRLVSIVPSDVNSTSNIDETIDSVSTNSTISVRANPADIDISEHVSTDSVASTSKSQIKGTFITIIIIFAIRCLLIPV
jgi:hypothetical protein